MKATGIVRKVDELGRVVVPVELRRILSIEERDSVEIFTQGDMIILRKYEPACVFCGEAHGVSQFKGKNVCASCLGVMAGQHQVAATTTTVGMADKAYVDLIRP